MPVKAIKPTSNARRQMTVIILGKEGKIKRDKSLCFGVSRSGGRNQRGKLTSINTGGGSKKVIRIVDFNQTSHLGVAGVVAGVEYDPGRTAYIAKIDYSDGNKSYILSADGLKKGAKVICDEKAPIRPGNRMQLKNIPLSTQIYNLEMAENNGGTVVRSAGSYATLLGVDKDWAQVKMPSGEIRRVKSSNYASIGIVSNIEHSKLIIGKAGRVRLSGRRPHVRGKAKNPCDHPHGGGEGNTSIGLKRPKTPWGMPAIGHKTRKKSKRSSVLILRKRT